jgi:hypothetical protein
VDAVVRAWLGFLALGAGVIHLALAIGAPAPVAAPLLAIGAAEFTWGVFAFTAPRIPLPRVARLLALVPILGWVAVLLAGGGGLGVRTLPMLVASLFDVVIAIGISIALRRAGRAPAPIGSARYLVGVGVGALIVAALTVPALAATEAAGSAVPDVDLPGIHPSH